MGEDKLVESLVFANGLIKHHQCIPKGMIKNIKVIRDGQKK